MRKSILAILSDFDGTITSINILEQLYKQFADPYFRGYVEQWELGKISTREEIEGCFANIKANRIEMETYLSTANIDPGLVQIIQFCKHRDVPFAIVSDGLRWYIDYILERHDINNVTVYANEINFMPNGFWFSYPWFDIHDPLRGTSKTAIIRKYQHLGYSVVFIGDGLSDTGAAKTADVLFSRGFLSDYARAHDIEAIAFSSLSGVLKSLGDIC